MANENVSKTGKWVDVQTGKVVSSQPEEGRQLVAPGGELTPDVKAAISAAEAAAQAPVETATDPNAVEKATMKNPVANRSSAAAKQAAAAEAAAKKEEAAAAAEAAAKKS